MVFPLRAALLTMALVAALAGCASIDQFGPGRTAIRSASPDAKGYVVIGLADENARKGSLFARYLSFSVSLQQTDGLTEATARRDSCISVAGMRHGETCAGQPEMAWHVLELQPGAWTVASVSEERMEGVPARKTELSVPFPSGTAFRVGPGEVVYIGDFLFSIDFDAQSVVLKTHTRDDGAAGQALSGYPGLRGAITYRDPAKPA